MPMGIVIRRSSFIMNLDLMRLQNNTSEVQTLNIFCVKYNRKAIGKMTSICDINFSLFGSTVFQQLLHQFSSLERQILDFRFNSWFWSHLILRLKIHYQGPICFHDNHSNKESNWIHLLPYFFVFLLSKLFLTLCSNSQNNSYTWILSIRTHGISQNNNESTQFSFLIFDPICVKYSKSSSGFENLNETGNMMQIYRLRWYFEQIIFQFFS